MKVVVDSNPLIGLAKGGVFLLLRDLFREVCVPSVVRHEVVELGRGRPGGPEVMAAEGSWLQVLPAPPASGLALTLRSQDQDVVSLAQALPAQRLITDDTRVRRVATSLGLPLLSTLDVIWLGHHSGLVAACRPVLDRMRAAGFSITEDAYRRALQRVGEA